MILNFFIDGQVFHIVTLVLPQLIDQVYPLQDNHRAIILHMVHMVLNINVPPTILLVEFHIHRKLSILISMEIIHQQR
ncbi:unnamed protein product [Onchocerca flexuosa]|uniref:Secreted protein n=1 Tax=Onchocerca flexuosa TaxID=387005 RepID=A0A183HPI7_9BILA|nr:unnamed protein product [Onchocerca flexuosa]